MKELNAYFVRASLKAKEGMVQIVLNVPVSDMTTRGSDDLTAFDEMAQWDHETELKLSVRDSQMTIPFTKIS